MEKTVVLGICGGIAAYKAADIVSRLRKAHVSVYCILTAHGAAFVQPLTFESLSNHPVVTDMFASPATWETEHVALAQRADVFLVAPATANIMAKMAHGIADDMLSTTLLATNAPIVVAPAMNTRMYEHTATQNNLSVLRSRGVVVVPPASGCLACGDVGIGKLADTADIVTQVLALLQVKQDLLGKHIVVTAGPTRERIDPVRYLTNDSSGKMGYAIAEAACARGAQVTLITGPTALPMPADVTCVAVETTQEMHDAAFTAFTQADMVIGAAAPADFRMAAVSAHKLKKDGNGSLALQLEQTPDILAALGAQKQPRQLLVAFAAETQDLLVNAQSKLARKHADMLVANDVTQPGAGFNSDTNIVTLLFADGHQEALPQMDKRVLADVLLDQAAALWK